MSTNPPKSPRSPSLRFSRQGFHPLRDNPNDMPPNDATIDIPLETVVSRTPSTGMRSGSVAPITKMATHEEPNEKEGATHHYGRRVKKLDKGERTGKIGYDGEEDYINRVGKIYFKILHFSIITRYFIYVLPLALCIAVPIIVGATAAQDAKIGGVRIVWFFTWVEIVWLSVWVSKIIAHFLPKIFQILAGVISSGVRKYFLVLRALEIPISLVGWAVTSLATFIPLMVHNPDIQAKARQEKAETGKSTADSVQEWQKVVRQILAAAVVSACVLLVEKFLIQLISINYHRKQFNAKIKENKRQTFLLGLLYDASRALFPAYCREFQEEDYIINDTLRLNLPGAKKGHRRSGSATPMRLLHDVGRVGDKITSAFGNIASEITGKQVFNPDSAHSIVVSALEKPRSSEALAKRLWMSFVVEGRNALYHDDIVEVLGAGREAEAEEAFAALDNDGNGDISLDEMILQVTEIGRSRKSVATSMHDVDQAINVLDGLLATVVFVICVFVFIAFLNSSFVTTLATAGTALLSLSFVFSVTCQEVLGSCIFLFVKHPFDVGDRVDLSSGVDQLTVEHISLLFTVFKRVTNGRTVQIPNIVLNSLWIENTTRSLAMSERIPIYVAFGTSFEDITALKDEMQKFVRDKENARDFYPDIDIDVRGIAELNKLELQIECRHKSNWGNEALSASRRNRFMCALVQALRKIPIDPPGGNDAALGSADQPSFSVAISPSEALERRQAFLDGREKARLYPSKKEEPAAATSSGVDYVGSEMHSENQAINTLTARPIGSDPYRDGAFADRADQADINRTGSIVRSSMDAQDAEDVRSNLKRESTRGKRKAGPTSPSAITVSGPGGENSEYYDYGSPVSPQQSQASYRSQQQSTAYYSLQQQQHQQLQQQRSQQSLGRRPSNTYADSP
ncbi:Serine threonine protein kinase [Lasiodiplodia theobromae]|uniref:Serine threonine protein kinase n=1 Tax=Lasiodiplodia theobromae TaxID=45133 RepID=UPI0015C35F77|nr:Serine threonine protein kinase [Lasiodiplodia theobromae]KAF4545065.1 Serine threonine protein kinase [Lasiodiplodia theobromae]